MYPINFLPFVGTKYGTNNIFGKKIMVLGESHYGEYPSADMTSEVMAHYLDLNVEHEGWMNTFKKFERSLVNKTTDRKESAEIWNSLMFYNYVQELMTYARVAPSLEQYQNSEEAFFKVLEEYQPELVIVWGRRLWLNLPDTNWIDGEEVKVDGNKVDNGYYKLSNGHKVQVVDVYHPSTAYDTVYWSKVLSGFIKNKAEKIFAISQVSFRNFRRFVEFPTMDLGGVNIIVGKNNAGKSTFDKATNIYLDFLRQWITGSALSLDFNTTRCRKLGINSYNEALSYYADDDDIVFSMTIGRYNYKTTFKRSDDECIADVRSITVTDLKDNNSTYTFDYALSQTKIKATASLPVFSPSVAGIDIVEKFVISPLCNNSEEEKKQVYSAIDTIRECIVCTDFSDDNSLKAFEQIEQILGSDVPDDFGLVWMLRDAISQIIKENDVVTSIWLPRKTSIADFMAKLKVINDIQSSYDESLGNNIYSRNIEHIGLFSYSQHKTFSIYDVDDASESLAKAVVEYCRSKKTQKGESFIGKWLTAFEIGTSLCVESFGDESYSLNVNTLEGRSVALTTLGSGAIHIVALLLRIVTTISKNGFGENTIISVEEPEINFHPDRQSKLADFFLDVYETFGCQIIVETHSEYLVRMCQVLVGNKFKDSTDKDFSRDNPFKVYYFPDSQIPYYNMVFTKVGGFKKKFGLGFFNEAGRLDSMVTNNKYDSL